VGDGDAFGIGLTHLIHAARSNADMTVIVNDNLGYQSTGGQYGWTTPQGSKTDSSPYGMFEHNLMSEGLDVMHILKGRATFLARHVSMDGSKAVETVKKAILNKGFSLVHMPYPCPTNFASRELGSRNQVNIYRWIKDRAAPWGKKKKTPFGPPASGTMRAIPGPSFPKWCGTPLTRSGGQARYERQNRDRCKRLRRPGRGQAWPDYRGERRSSRGSM
jgi:pyruvate/2-oxoacid:ferredoxin oxidoreductase beta subunit